MKEERVLESGRCVGVGVCISKLAKAENFKTELWINLLVWLKFNLSLNQDLKNEVKKSEDWIRDTPTRISQGRFYLDLCKTTLFSYYRKANFDSSLRI